VNVTSPQSDYAELVRFLITPFLEEPDKLSIHCETYANGKIWVRLAFADADKGHVFGRNGRTIQVSLFTLKCLVVRHCKNPVAVDGGAVVGGVERVLKSRCRNR
jgi:predicted RNA-binding protein YlqC (UPF0109 family)